VLACHSADIASFKLSEPLRATLIGLDLTDNSLRTISPGVPTQSAVALPSPANTLVLPPGGCWLRSLCLRANDLFCLPPLASMPKLLHLDLSYNQQLHRVLSLDEQPVREAFAAVPLRSIMLEGIGLTALPPCLTTVGKSSGPGGAPRNVVILHLGYNQIPTKKAMEEALKDFPRLTDLTIAGNPVSTHLCFTSYSAAPDVCMANRCGAFRCCWDLVQAAILDDVVEWASKLAKSTLTALTTLNNKPVAAVSMAAAIKSAVRYLVSKSDSSNIAMICSISCYARRTVVTMTRASVQKTVLRAHVWRATRASHLTTAKIGRSGSKSRSKLANGSSYGLAQLHRI
jgi:hypothetical protein